MGLFGGRRRRGRGSDDLFDTILGGIGVVAGIAAAAGAVAYGISKANEKDLKSSAEESIIALSSSSGDSLLFIPEGEPYLTSIYCRLIPFAVGYVISCGDLDKQTEKLSLVETILVWTKDSEGFPLDHITTKIISESFDIVASFDNVRFAQIPQYILDVLFENLENPSVFVMNVLLPLIADSLRRTNSAVEEAMMTFGRPYGLTHTHLREIMQNAGFNYNQQPNQPTMQQVENERLAQAYVMLGLNSDATASQVRSAYRRLSQKFHPDVIQNKGLDNAVEEAFAARFAEITDSYNLIFKNLDD